jgi:hypothetical protein
VSHFKEREEKVCLNCSAELSGRYCHQCGQENREPRSTVWGLITHFFYDITHFDGKFFSTTGRLITRPGRLPKEYIRGKRASYLDPIRMYIFSSAIFFLIFFSVYHVGDISDDNLPKKKAEAVLVRAEEELLKNSTTREDSLLIKEQFARTGRELKITEPVDSARAADTATRKDSTRRKRTDRGWQLSFAYVDYPSKEAYDSAQRALPASRRDNWLERRLNYRSIELNKRMDQDENRFWKDVISKFVHTFPYLLFVSLPLYALYLKLLYIRRTKKYYYVDHCIFLIFLYIFTFIFLLIFLGIDQLEETLKWEWLDYIIVAMFLWGVYYAWRAMHKFYEQGKFKTTIKFLLFNLMCLVSLVLLFGLFFLLTVFSI